VVSIIAIVFIRVTIAAIRFTEENGITPASQGCFTSSYILPICNSAGMDRYIFPKTSNQNRKLFHLNRHAAACRYDYLQYKKTPDEAGVWKLKFKNYKLQSIHNSYFIIIL